MALRSLTQTLPVQLRQMARQPVWWAVVSSVGFHGLLFVVLPLLPTPSSRASEPDIPDPVGVVELDPDELARLPDFSTPDFSLPAPADSETLYSFGDSEDLDEFSSLDPDLPSSAPIPAPFPGVSTLPPLPFPSRVPPSLPPQTFRDLLRQSPPLSPGATLTPPPVTPAPIEEPEAPSAETPPAEAPGDNAADALRPQPTEEAAVPEASEPPPSEPSPDEIARQRQEALLAEQQRLQEQFTYSPFGESDINSAVNAFKEAGQGINASGGGVVELVLPYPPGACPLNFEEGQVVEAHWGAFVDGENKVLNPPEPILLYSSGYKFFDDIALEAIAAGAFTEQLDGSTGVPRSYTVIVKFIYSSDSCPAVLPPSPVSGEPPTSDDVAGSAAPAASGSSSSEG